MSQRNRWPVGLHSSRRQARQSARQWNSVSSGTLFIRIRAKPHDWYKSIFRSSVAPVAYCCPVLYEDVCPQIVQTIVQLDVDGGYRSLPRLALLMERFDPS